MMMNRAARRAGFTLLEVLIAVAILGVIATFAIPKILQASGDAKMTAVFKESMAAVSGSYTAYDQVQGLSYGANGTNGATLLDTYLNHVRKLSSGHTEASVTTAHGDEIFNCSTSEPCYELHNGAWLQAGAAANDGFQERSATHAIQFNLDPDGLGRGAGMVTVYMLANGRLVTYSDNQGVPAGLGPAALPDAELDTDPEWATWS